MSSVVTVSPFDHLKSGLISRVAVFAFSSNERLIGVVLSFVISFNSSSIGNAPAIVFCISIQSLLSEYKNGCKIPLNGESLIEATFRV